MNTLEIVKNVDWVGVLDPNLKSFDIILDTKNGTTYNSYLIQGKNKIAIIDGVKHGFEQEYFDKIQSKIKDLSKIDYIIVNHTEPDHSAAITQLLDKAPNAVVYATKPAIKFLSAIVNKHFKSVEIDENLRLNLGGKTLRFFKVPFLHWPDTMFTYLEEDSILFPCDAFGAHYCNEKMFNNQCIDYTADAFYYFDMIVRPFKAKVLQAIDKVVESKIELKAICPSHGPLLTCDPMKMVKNYIKWSQPLVTEKNQTILIMYFSAHTNTEQIAKKIKDNFVKEKVTLLDIMNSSMPEIRNEIEKAKAIIVGSPTILGDFPYPMWEALAHIATVPKNAKIGAAFGSYGWSGEAVGRLTNRLKDLKIPVIDEGLKINFVASEDNKQQIEGFCNSIKDKLS